MSPAGLGANEMVRSWRRMITLHGAMPLAFILAEVSLRLDVRGGTHIYVMQGLAPRLGFLIAWIHWTRGRAGSPVLLPR